MVVDPFTSLDMTCFVLLMHVKTPCVSIVCKLACRHRKKYMEAGLTGRIELGRYRIHIAEVALRLAYRYGWNRKSIEKRGRLMVGT